MEGLEATELKLSEVRRKNPWFRVDAEYFQKDYLLLEKQLEKIGAETLESLSHSIINFGAYSLCNEIKYLDSGVPFLSVGDIKENSIEIENVRLIDAQLSRQLLSKSLVREGQVLLTIAGTVGNAAVAHELPIDTNSNQAIANISLRSVSPFYAATFLNSRYGKQQTKRLIVSNVQPNLLLIQVKSIELPVLSDTFQKAIEKVVKNAHVTKELSSDLYAQAENLLLDALGLRDWQPPEPVAYEQKFSEIFSSSRWDAEYHQPGAMELNNRLKSAGSFDLSTLADVSNGFPWQSDSFIEGDEAGEPFVRIRDCKPGVIEISQLDKLETKYADSQMQPKAQKGDLVLGMDGLKWFYAGLIYEPCYVNQRVAWIKPHENNPVSSEYLMLIINSIIGQKQLLRQMTIAHTVGHITNVDVRNLLIPELTKETRELLTSKVQDSFKARQKAKSLLEAAKRAVEIAIESDETAALAYLEAQTAN